MTEPRKNDCRWLGDDGECMNRKTHPDHVIDPKTYRWIPLETDCKQKPGCGYIPKRKLPRKHGPHRTRQGCRWWSEGWCGLFYAGCDGVYDGCGWEKKPTRPDGEKPRRRNRRRCKWFDGSGSVPYCGIPQRGAHLILRCNGVQMDCGYEERKEQEA